MTDRQSIRRRSDGEGTCLARPKESDNAVCKEWRTGTKGTRRARRAARRKRGGGGSVLHMREQLDYSTLLLCFVLAELLAIFAIC